LTRSGARIEGFVTLRGQFELIHLAQKQIMLLTGAASGTTSGTVGRPDRYAKANARQEQEISADIKNKKESR
jgi:hypothetical protein